MTIHRLLRLPAVSAILLGITILGRPTSSFGLTPRRLWTPLGAAGSSFDHGGDQGASDEAPEVPEIPAEPTKANAFEKVVRIVTKNKDYKFGDITRSVVNTTTSGVEGAVRTVTKKEDYQFGDLTKKALGSTTHGIEGVVRSVTKNEDYQFGDLTRNTMNTANTVLTYSEKTLNLIRENNVHELIEILNMYWNQSMNYEERKESFAVAVYLGAILVLSYNWVANVMSGMVFAAAWARMSLATGVSPLTPGMWSRFLETKATFDMFFGGPCLPVRAIVTIPFFFNYRKLVVGMAYLSPLRAKFPILNRVVSILLSYVVFNLAFVGGMTHYLIRLLSMWTGVPMSPAAI